MTSAADFFRGKSRKYSSMYWISNAPCFIPYCLIRNSTAPYYIVARSPEMHRALDPSAAEQAPGGLTTEWQATLRGTRSWRVGVVDPEQSCGQPLPGPLHLSLISAYSSWSRRSPCLTQLARSSASRS